MQGPYFSKIKGSTLQIPQDALFCWFDGYLPKSFKKRLVAPFHTLFIESKGLAHRDTQKDSSGPIGPRSPARASSFKRITIIISKLVVNYTNVVSRINLTNLLIDNSSYLYYRYLYEYITDPLKGSFIYEYDNR